ncbi:ABC transporter ATP-binding protein [uncultured Modestobacter sp.]|uniref:dipeptide ABC transporter ATP-binding protein n=1 Tax=uncultured Modestobacter sp. TaxID=380048 RepID=UPI00262F0858|nr:ABC transporter ATP-binding protein [uncultured Modestobacter sp.]
MTLDTRTTDPDVVLAVEDLHVEFVVEGRSHTAVRSASWELRRGEVLAVVGESGSGKSVSAMAVLGLLPRNARVTGHVRHGGRDLLTLAPRELRALRGAQISVVFQDPSAALDPVFTVGQQVVEVLRAHRPGMTRAEARARAVELFTLVDLPDPEARLRFYPHQLSGGQCQRVMIAMALACDPAVLIADEPTTALDVTVQQEVLDVLRALRGRVEASIVLITHDMGVVADLADRVVVMRHGEVVECAPVQELFDAPRAAYTRALLDAVPRRRPADARRAAAPAPGGTGAADRPVLLVEELVVEYRQRRGAVRAVDGVTLRVDRGEILALVGESGSGKSTIGRCALGLAPLTAGRVQVAGVQLGRDTPRAVRESRKRVGVVFQNPMASLNPRRTVADSVGEPLYVHSGLRGGALHARTGALLDSVELPGGWGGRYPHELSGGQRQRVAIARAIALDPELLIADEPTSALDVSVQATVLDLLADIQQRLGFACLFITHDLAVVGRLCDRVAVLAGGRLVEQGRLEQVLDAPADPYTRRLVAAAPVPDPREQARRRELRLAGAMA